MTDYLELLTIAHRAVDLASELQRSLQPGRVAFKGDRDMATDADVSIERRIREYLERSTPDISFLGEEEGTTGPDSDLTWIFDPIDGTVNFIRGHPLCAVSLGLVLGDQAVLGVIDLPALGTRYAAAQHHGAFSNGRRLGTSNASALHEAVVAIGDYAVGDNAETKNRLRLAVTNRLVTRAQRVRMHGAAAIDLAWLADGKVDAVIICANRPWDTSAGVVIARESGALVLDRDGSDHTAQSAVTIAAGIPLIAETLALVQSAENDG